MAILEELGGGKENFGTITAVVVGLFAIFSVYRLLKVGSRDPRIPPGPPTVPILGNLLQIPRTGLSKK